MKSSVVICVYTEERWEDIRAAVESVENQRRRPYEIILVVDYNTDLHLRLKQEYPGVTVVENTNEKGLSGGKNTGAATASGDIVAYLDDDAVAEPGWLEALEEGFQDPTIVGVGGQTRPPGPRGDVPAGSRTSSTGPWGAPIGACPRSGRRSATSWAATPPSAGRPSAPSAASTPG